MSKVEVAYAMKPNQWILIYVNVHHNQITTSMFIL